MSIGERILELRKQKNISQVQLAKALGISRQAVSKWENDLAAPDMMNLIHLADLLVTDTEYLATGVHAKQKAQPSIVTVVQRVDNVVEKVVEKPVEVEKIVEVERVVEKVIEIPKVKKVVRYRYLRNPVEFIAVGLLGMIIGFLIGILI
jgi:transcriptional regulator with XRE-family HTH domain